MWFSFGVQKMKQFPISVVFCGRRHCCLTVEPSVWWFVEGETVDWWGSHQWSGLWKERLLTDRGAINEVVCGRRLLADEGAISMVVCGKRDCWLMREPSMWWLVEGETVVWQGIHQYSGLWKERLGSISVVVCRKDRSVMVCERRGMTEGISEVVCAKVDWWWIGVFVLWQLPVCGEGLWWLHSAGHWSRCLGWLGPCRTSGGCFYCSPCLGLGFPGKQRQ